jgi:hypothetical protein
MNERKINEVNSVAIKILKTTTDIVKDLRTKMTSQNQQGNSKIISKRNILEFDIGTDRMERKMGQVDMILAFEDGSPRE